MENLTDKLENFIENTLLGQFSAVYKVFMSSDCRIILIK
jgi:hypothetical protein